MEFLANTDIEHLDRENWNKNGVLASYVKGKGVFIKALEEELQKKDLTVKIYEQDSIAEMRGERTPLKLE